MLINKIKVGDIIIAKDNHVFEVYAVGLDVVYINRLQEFIFFKEIIKVIPRFKLDLIRGYYD